MVNRRVIRLLDQIQRDPSLISPYLKRPLRSLEEVEAERQIAGATMAAAQPSQTPAAAQKEKMKKNRKSDLG